MQTLITKVQSTSIVQKVAMIFSILLIIGALVFFTSKETTADYRLLYADLDLRASGQIVESLEAQNIPYTIKQTAIYVPADQVARIRMDLAARGLPRSNAPGYELLDKINGFQTTNRMYNVNYVRALEGELAQTIAASEAIEQARVHIAHDQGAGVLRPGKVSASVMITAGIGIPLSADQARAIQHLVSSAVSNMSPKDVNVLDSAGNLLTDRKSDQLVRSQEEDKIRDKLMRLLSARFGAANAVVEVAIEQSFKDEVIRERIIDPDSRVALRQESEESQSQRDEIAQGVAGVASNLPERDGARDGASTDSETQTRAKIQYDVSKTEREVLNPAGAIKRLTVAVLINKDVLEQSAQSLEALTSLLSAAAGVDQTRGDSLMVEAMSFANISQTPATVMGSSSGVMTTTAKQTIPSWIWTALLAIPLVLIAAFIFLRGTKSGASPQQRPAQDMMAFGEGQQALNAPAPQNDPEIIDPQDALLNVVTTQEESAVMLIKHWLDEEQAA